METILVSGVNMLSAGTVQVMLSFISGVNNSSYDNYKFIIFLPDTNQFRSYIKNIQLKNNIKIIWCNNGWLKIFYRIHHYYVGLPSYASCYRPIATLGFGNYMPYSKKNYGKVAVLLQHSFILDDKLYKKIGVVHKIREMIRRWLFFRTIRYVDVVIVQSTHMKDLFLIKYPKTQCEILSNPIADIFMSSNVGKESNAKIMIYPSRYYEHKNHIFIIELVKKYKSQLRLENICFYVTLNSQIGGAKQLLQKINDENIEDLVVNVGEISQEQLANHYSSSYALFFPSKTESFGNAFIEAMAFGLPIVAPDLDYAHAICGDAALYYTENDLDKAFSIILELAKNQLFYNAHTDLSFAQFKKYLTVSQWTSQLLSILHSSSNLGKDK